MKELDKEDISRFRQKKIVDLEKKAADQKKIEKAIRTSETRFRRLFETTQDGILILDANSGQINDINPFLIKLLGYPKEDIMGKKLWEIGPFKDITESKEAFSQLQQKKISDMNTFPWRQRTAGELT